MAACTTSEAPTSLRRQTARTSPRGLPASRSESFHCVRAAIVTARPQGPPTGLDDARTTECAPVKSEELADQTAVALPALRTRPAHRCPVLCTVTWGLTGIPRYEG